MKTLILLLFSLPALAAEFIEVRNSDDTFLRRVTQADNWVAPAHKFGPEHATRFVKLSVGERPVVDSLIFDIAITNRITETTWLRDFVAVRQPTFHIVLNIREEAERRVELATQSRDAINAAFRWIELHEKRLNGGTLTANETNQVQNIRTAYNRAKAIRAHAATLEANAATITTTEGWPE